MKSHGLVGSSRVQHLPDRMDGRSIRTGDGSGQGIDVLRGLDPVKPEIVFLICLGFQSVTFECPETFEKRSILFKVKEDENFNHPA